MAYSMNDACIDVSNKQAARRVDDMLDDAVADSFPASDPVSLAMPHHRIESSGLSRMMSKPGQFSTAFLLGGGLLAAIAYLALRK